MTRTNHHNNNTILESDTKDNVPGSIINDATSPTSTPVPYYLRPNAKQRQMNAIMSALVPELNSPEYAYTPLARNAWRQPHESLRIPKNNNDSDGAGTTNFNTPTTTTTNNNTSTASTNDNSNIPCYIPASRKEYQTKGRLDDYIWMPKRGKDIPPGYYHLATQEAWIEAYKRFCRAKRQSRGGLLGCCCGCCGKGQGTDSSSYPTREERQLQDDIQKLLWNRVVAEEPDDVQAQRMKLLNLQSVGGQRKAFGRAAYLPTLTSVILLGYY